MLQVLIWVIILLVHWMFISTYCDIVNQEKLRVTSENERLKREVMRLEEDLLTLQERAPLRDAPALHGLG